MAAASDTNALVIEDMNGPLAYFGPAPTARPSGLTPAEQTTLLRLRDRLEREGSVGLTQFLGSLALNATPAAAFA
jgi:hypothetical protein